MKVLSLSIAMVIVSSLAGAGTMGPDSSRAGVTVRTPGDSAFVVIDSILTGYAPFTVDTLLPGRHVVRLLALPVTRWSARPIADTFDISAGEHRNLAYDLPLTVRVSSMPSGATAWLGKSLLGVTPFLMPSGSLYPGDSLVLKAEGYEQSAVITPDTLGRDIMVPMNRSWQAQPQQSEFPGLEKNGDRPPFHLIGPIAGTVIAGTIAAYCKIHADNVNDQYLTTGDGALLREVRHYDVISAITLVVAETGMALLAYYLLSP